MWLGSRTSCARARCVAHLLLFHLCRLGFDQLAGVERRERRRQFVAGNDPGHQCSAPPGILTRVRARQCRIIGTSCGLYTRAPGARVGAAVHLCI
jgi:hypothetical protein